MMSVESSKSLRHVCMLLKCIFHAQFICNDVDSMSEAAVAAVAAAATSGSAT